MTESNYKVQGFLRNSRVQQKQVVNARNLKSTFIGFKLDEIQLQGTIKSKNELDHLIRFLSECAPCFNEASVKHDIENDAIRPY